MTSWSDPRVEFTTEFGRRPGGRRKPIGADDSAKCEKLDENKRVCYAMKKKSIRGRGTRSQGVSKRAPRAIHSGGASVGKSVGDTARPIDPKWSWHYRTLLQLRDRLLQDSENKLHEVAQGVEPHSMHPADSATDEFDHDLALILLAREENALTDVNDAITRILEGKYGVCEETGVLISPRRLRALPWCRYSRQVEEQLEKGGIVTKLRIPEAISVQGAEPEIPGRGKLPREGEDTEPEELEEPEITQLVQEVSVPATREIEPAAPLPRKHA